MSDEFDIQAEDIEAFLYGISRGEGVWLGDRERIPLERFSEQFADLINRVFFTRANGGVRLTYEVERIKRIMAVSQLPDWECIKVSPELYDALLKSIAPDWTSEHPPWSPSRAESHFRGLPIVIDSDLGGGNPMDHWHLVARVPKASWQPRA